MPSTTRDRASYGVGIVCALPLEKAAVMGMLDEEHPRLPTVEGDANDYTLGRIGDHDVLVACLPAGGTGKASAATVAANMQRSFRVRIGLMVGIGGGVPSKSRDVRLRDVVVSQPTEQHGGVVQWDFGKMERGGVFRRTGMLNKPPAAVLLNALAGLQARHEVEEPQMSKHIDGMLFRRPRMAPAYDHQGGENDWLFEADYDHGGEETCEACDRDRLIRWPARTDEKEIVVHAGNIASGDEVMKDGRARDRIAASDKVICFEMEAAGLMDNFPCLVIRGICDYADSHKHKRWKRYAAAAAAACAKELLLAMPVAEVSKTPKQRVQNLPFEENPQFTGRRSELEALEQKLFGQPCRQHVAVVGLGGIGKTQVASSFAYSVWKKHLELSIIWVPAISAETIERAFEEIAELLELPTPSDDNRAAGEVVCRHLSTPAAGSWLMIVDNADDASILNGDAQRSGLLRYLPRSNQGLTLFTTRNYEIAQSLAGSDVVDGGRLAMLVFVSGEATGRGGVRHASSSAPRDADLGRERAVSHLSTIFPFGEHEKRNMWRAYLPHAARINQDVTNVGVDGKGELYKLVGYCLHVNGRLKDAVLWLKESCYCFRNLAETASERLSAEHVLAMAYKANGQVKEAVRLMQYVISVKRKTMRPGHPSRMVSEQVLSQWNEEDSGLPGGAPYTL
ncbi:hypothetical protein LTR17_026302 [Elasticomyces elasticus]|nr:hypothetical protein LTR17_026302 [Elasticomyces elasticus]